MIPARCNKRDCQARRNLSKRPELYVRWPTCHRPTCTGKMYVDRYRLRHGPRDNAPVCRSGTCVPASSTGTPLLHHRVSTRGCEGHNAWVTARNTAPRSKHSPIPADEWVPF